jgi:hypothetical protein
MMKESIKQLRLSQSREFNRFCDNILAHDGSYSKPVIQHLEYYRQLFSALLGINEFHKLASEDLQRLFVIHLHIERRNQGQN